MAADAKIIIEKGITNPTNNFIIFKNNDRDRIYVARKFLI